MVALINGRGRPLAPSRSPYDDDASRVLAEWVHRIANLVERYGAAHMAVQTKRGNLEQQIGQLVPGPWRVAERRAAWDETGYGVSLVRTPYALGYIAKEPLPQAPGDDHGATLPRRGLEGIQSRSSVGGYR